MEDTSQAITNTYALTLIDPSDSTVLSATTSLNDMLITALRVTSETQQIYSAVVVDTVSYTLGDGSGYDYCHERTYAISSSPVDAATTT